MHGRARTGTSMCVGYRSSESHALWPRRSIRRDMKRPRVPRRSSRAARQLPRQGKVKVTLSRAAGRALSFSFLLYVRRPVQLRQALPVQSCRVRLGRIRRACRRRAVRRHVRSFSFTIPRNHILLPGEVILVDFERLVPSTNNAWHTHLRWVRMLQKFL